MKQVSTLLLLLFLSNSLFAQIDFDRYEILQSKGSIPSDFSDHTFEKIDMGMNQDRSEIKTKGDQREFLEKTGYAIDELLHSGLVTYGDDLSNYISSIADKLLANKPDLRSKLRFYALKLNTSNAFSTDQGIIFVTTGLISQLSSEAQLAYILAHEISHYTEKHVVQTFTFQKKNENQRFGSSWVNKMSVYSREKEFSADELAVEIYWKAGYSKEEVLSTFDVLLYSYLPFDEIPIQLEYFMTEKLFLPDFLFTSKDYKIKADANANDSKSSHPNISRRKKAVETRIGQIKEGWGQIINSVSDKRFVELRNIARFETVRTDVVQANFGNALYSIFLLERDFPNSRFLQRMKMHTWLGLYQYEVHSKTENTILSKSEREGESGQLHYFIDKLDRNGLTTLALRNIYDIHKLNSDDLETAALYRFTLKLLSEDEQFDISKYSALTFSEYDESIYLLQEFNRNVDDEKSDTLKILMNSKDGNIENNVEKEDVTLSIDSLIYYYYYGLSDIVMDSNFRREISQQPKLLEQDLDEPSSGGRKKSYVQRNYNNLKIGVDKLIVVEPSVVHYSKKGMNPRKSEKMEVVFSESISDASKRASIEIHMVDKRNLTTSTYNERSILFDLLLQSSQDYFVRFPVDYNELQKISDKSGCDKLMFTLVLHNFRPKIKAWPLIVAGLLYPTFPFVAGIYVPIAVLLGNQTNLLVMVMDIQTGQFVTSASFNFHEKVSKQNIGTRMFSIFKHLSMN